MPDGRIVYNFNAGPATLPPEVMAQARQEFVDYRGLGYGILEASHRASAFQEIIGRTESNVRELMGLDDDYAVLKAEKLMPELYLGRFSDHLARERPSVLALNDNDIPWLITCDRGLVELGAATESSRAPFKMEMAGVDRRYATHPAQFGLVVLTGGMVEEDEWGRIYLIRLRRPLELPPKRPGN